MSELRSAEPRPLRADAEKNRQKILDAAATVFAQNGLDATLDDIAAAADVGVATVYRRFPDKDSLVAALFESGIDDIVALAVQAATFEDSWEGFVWFLDEALERQCVNRGLRDVIVGSRYAQQGMIEAKRRIGPAIMTLVARAQRDGYLRSDLVESDVPVLEMMISSLGGVANELAPNLWRRYLGIVLDGLVVSRTSARELAPSPPEHVVAAALRASKGLKA